MAKIPAVELHIPIAEDTRRQFLKGEKLTFAFSVEDAQILWWGSKFGSTVTPFRMASALGRGVRIPIDFCIERIDVGNGEVRIQLGSTEGGTEILRAERSVLLNSRAISLNFMEIRYDRRGLGLGTQLVANCYELAKALRLDRLIVTAVDDGSYMWAKVGFVPYHHVWNSSAFKDGIARRLGAIVGLGWEEQNDVYLALSSEDPHAIYILASMRTPVPSTVNPGKQIPLGRALLGESGVTWKGSLEFSDGPANARARAQLPIGSR